MQQAAFDAFRAEYNHQRPHEGLDNDTPGDHYRLSPRVYPLIVPAPTYPDDMTLRWVKSQGDISWHNTHVYLSETLAGQLVGLRQTDTDRWEIYFARFRVESLRLSR